MLESPRRRHRGHHARGRRPVLATVVAVLATGCTQGGLDPRGDEAVRILDIFVALLIGAAIVSVAVLVLWVWGSLRPARDEDEDPRAEHVPDSTLARRFVVGGGLVMPAIVLAIYFGVQVVSTTAQTQPAAEGLTIEVTGHRYWWEVTYRGVEGIEPFETANQLHVPVDTPVTIRLRSDDVIHSFWVPELAGKVDLVPGRPTAFALSADEPGTYAGYCAEYCGLQHTWMKFEVVAMPPDEFTTWASGQAEPAPEPTTELAARGREVFEGQSCVGCHTIRGVAEEGDVGPDLTHLASRSEIGAGIRKLTEEQLRIWIANTQSVKPGAQMPPQELERDELDALVAYLMSLE